MIDTIILSVPKQKVLSLDGEELVWNLHSKAKGYEKFVRNATAKDKEEGIYLPRLTGVKRNVGNQDENKSILIEFSVPKIIYKNNLDELEDHQFDEVIVGLKDRLKRMGLVITTTTLRSSTVNAVHYSKNIELTGGYTSRFVLTELAKVNPNKYFDVTKARYMNDGESLCVYCVSHSFVLYDKIADLKKDEKRAIDKDQTTHQRGLFDELEKKYKKPEVLRLEVRLSQKRKLNSVFKQLGFNEHPTFEEVFSAEKSKAVVNLYWNTLVGNHSFILFGMPSTPKDLLKKFYLANPKIRPARAVYFLGLVILAKDGNGIRELRSIVANKSNSSWYKIAKNLEQANELLGQVQYRDWFSQIKGSLSFYQKISTKNL